MEKFLGVLFCGGRGTRLGEITRYTSKSFLPVYDRPVFMYGLQLLEESKFVDEIIILTNDENDKKLRQTGYQTIVQDDKVVFDIFSGWEYIKKISRTKRDGILVPSDNLSNVNLDKLCEVFLNNKEIDLVFSLFEMNDKDKLRQMGNFNTKTHEFLYKPKNPKSPYGVIAPYVIKNTLDTCIGDNIFNKSIKSYSYHFGYWFDIGDVDSIIDASNYIKKINLK